MEIFYPEDFNALFGRGGEEPTPKKTKEKTLDDVLEEENLECLSEKKVEKDILDDIDETRSCPCDSCCDCEREYKDYEVSENKKPMKLPPKETPPKDSDIVVNQKKIGNAKYPLYAVSSEALSVCLNKLTYIWQNDGKEYWTYIFYVDHVSFVGWRWNKYIKDWVYFGIDISKIEAFTCRR